MLTVDSIDEVRSVRWQQTEMSWGLVPTMGYLHEGHLSLVRRARRENDRVGVSIYVNPSQFSLYEDLDTYPRDIEHDKALLMAEAVDLVFIPSDDEIYPRSFQSAVIVETITEMLEGAARPGHFRGVTTVVAKLLNIFQPTRVYFGQKDAQQAAVVSRMMEDLNFPVEMVVCPTVREADGLAMSSRNSRLMKDQRKAAPALYRALSKARETFAAGEKDANRLRDIMKEIILGEPLARLDYVSVADPETMTELEEIDGRALLSLAVFFGSVRLIDNTLVSRSEGI